VAVNRDISSLADEGKYADAAVKREDALVFRNDVHRQFRLQKYGTED